jgi:hypothetical protein
MAIFLPGFVNRQPAIAALCSRPTRQSPAHRTETLALALLVLGIAAQHIQNATPPNDFTIFTHLFYRRSNLHKSSPVYPQWHEAIYV